MEANINKYPDDVDILRKFLPKKTDKQCPDAANHFSEVDHLSERERSKQPYSIESIYIYIYIYILAHKQIANNVN